MITYIYILILIQTKWIHELSILTSISFTHVRNPSKINLLLKKNGMVLLIQFAFIKHYFIKHGFQLFETTYCLQPTWEWFWDIFYFSIDSTLYLFPLSPLYFPAHLLLLFRSSKISGRTEAKRAWGAKYFLIQIFLLKRYMESQLISIYYY